MYIYHATLKSNKQDIEQNGLLLLNQAKYNDGFY